jgi:ribonucleoside-diphosphate reductase alpha chain
VREREAAPESEDVVNKREDLPARRAGYVQKARIGGQKIYLHTGEYADGRLGEIFLTAAKTGTLLQALLDAFAISVSISLQHGVPLEEYVEAFKHTKFEPSGPVSGDARIKMASSILDYVFRELESTYLLGKELPVVEQEPVVERLPERVAGRHSTGSGV